MAKQRAKNQLFCTEVSLPEKDLVPAAERAIEMFPPNRPAGVHPPGKIAVLATKYWGARAREITVGFMERPSTAMVDQVLRYANTWSEFSNVGFRYTSDLSSAVVRVSFARGGYWSYLGTDCLSIPKNRQTMNLEGFTLRTPQSEWMRVVPHEFGHTLGCPHEHARKAIIELLDPEKVIALFSRTQGWSRQQVIEQILTPLEEQSIMTGGSSADVESIMTYQFPGSVTRNGRPIPGGGTFSEVDKRHFAAIYPKDGPKPPPPDIGKIVTLVGLDETNREVARYVILKEQ